MHDDMTAADLLSLIDPEHLSDVEIVEAAQIIGDIAAHVVDLERPRRWVDLPPPRRFVAGVLRLQLELLAGELRTRRSGEEFVAEVEALLRPPD